MFARLSYGPASAKSRFIAVEDKIKAAIKDSMKEIEKVQKQFDELVDDLPEHAKTVKNLTQETLKKIRARLDESMKEAQDDASEAQVQAHLGLMEAQDRLEASRKVIDEHLSQWQDKSRTAMDEMQLKAHLATMEAQDFWERRGQHLAEEFRQSQKSMQSLAAMAVKELQEQFGRWNAVFSGAASSTDEPSGASKKTSSKKTGSTKKGDA